MTILLFLIDTSGSMNQRTHLGAKQTLLDITKETVDRFIKFRQKDMNASRFDRYMLITFDEPPNNIKAGWKESLAQFSNELKNLQATSLTSLNVALKNAFEYLNVNRMHSGIDTYGMGRCPYFLESTIIILITDGGKFSTVNNVQDELIIPASNCVGSELTKEPFRWDQRLFSIVLRFNGVYRNDQSQPVTTVGCDPSPINQLCEETGGRSFSVTSKNETFWSSDYILAKMQSSGVMAKFEKFGPDPPMIPPQINGIPNDDAPMINNFDRSWQCVRNLIIVRGSSKGYSVGHWPIPESAWPDLNNPTFIHRTAHPVIRFTCTNSEPTVIENLPFDKYELEKSPLTNFILSRRQPNVAWQVFVANSQRNSEFGQPFGYLKASTNLLAVNLFVMPYNYPVLLPLLDELFKQLKGNPTREWRQQFDNYLKGVPAYYVPPLKRALSRMNAPNIIPDHLDQYANAINNMVKKQKAIAKIEYDKLLSISQHKSINIEWPRISTNHSSLMFQNRKTMNELFCTNPSLRRIFSERPNEFQDFNGFIVRYRNQQHSDHRTSHYRNPADIPRKELLRQIAKMRQLFFQKQKPSFKITLDDDQTFNLPVSQMGNYQEYLKKKQPPLRELEAAPSRQHMFGNPFKLDKKNPMIFSIDEADVELSTNGNGGGTSPNSNDGQPKGAKRSAPTANSNLSAGPPTKQRRKPGPLPKDFLYTTRSRSPSPAPLMYNNRHATPPPQHMMSPHHQQQSPSSSPNPYFNPATNNNNNMYPHHQNLNNQIFQQNGSSTTTLLQQQSSNPKILLHPQQQQQQTISPMFKPLNMRNAVMNNNNELNNNTGDLNFRGAFSFQQLSQQQQQQPFNVFKPIANNRQPFVNNHNQQPHKQHQMKNIQPLANGNMVQHYHHHHHQQQQQQSFHKPFPMLNNNLVNGNANHNNINLLAKGRQVGLNNQSINFHQQRSYTFSEEETEKLKLALHYVRIKDLKSLVQHIQEQQKKIFADRILIESLSYAQRFKMTSFIQMLNKHFGMRTQLALEYINSSNNYSKITSISLSSSSTTTLSNSSTTTIATNNNNNNMMITLQQQSMITIDNNNK